MGFTAPGRYVNCGVIGASASGPDAASTDVCASGTISEGVVLSDMCNRQCNTHCVGNRLSFLHGVQIAAWAIESCSLCKTAASNAESIQTIPTSACHFKKVIVKVLFT